MINILTIDIFKHNLVKEIKRQECYYYDYKSINIINYIIINV